MVLEKNLLVLKSNIREICSEIGRDPDEIKIVAISKTFPFTKINELNSLGQLDFGENKVRELREKYYHNSFNQTGNINWHMVGHLQSNKVEDVIAFISLIQSVDSLKLAEIIDDKARKIKRTIDILVQVNTTSEPQKFGIPPDEAVDLCNQISFLENVRLKGLMTIAKLTNDRENIRQSFRNLKSIYDELEPDMKDFEYLSMGMSNDYDIAIEEGSNMIRIGSAIFGERSNNY